MNKNNAEVIGRLGKDVESRTFDSGTTLAEFTVATSYRFKSGDEWKEETEWHNIKCFGKLADKAKQHLEKGSLVRVEGRIKTESWNDNAGVKKYKTVIIANVIDPAEFKKKDSMQTPQEQKFNNDLPF